MPDDGDVTVAEHVFALLLGISRHLVKAVERTRRGSFSQTGLRAFDLHTPASPEGYDLEALVANHVLLRFPNVIVTTHNAYNTEDAVQRIIETTLDNTRGGPRNVVLAAAIVAIIVATAYGRLRELMT